MRGGDGALGPRAEQQGATETDVKESWEKCVARSAGHEAKAMR